MPGLRFFSVFFTCLLLTSLPIAAQAFKCLPLYGNWCGPGHPANGSPPPVDAFDAACMRHDLCIAGAGPERWCDQVFVTELHSLAAYHGGLPRPLQWAEYAIRLKAGGAPWIGMPLPLPGDALGAFSTLTAPCW